MSIQTIKKGRVTWVNVTRPTLEDIKQIKESYDILHPLALEDCLSRMERPKIDNYDDHLFIVVQFPIWDASRRVSRPSEVDIFIGMGFLVTVHDGTLDPINNLFQKALDDEATQEFLFRQGAGRVLHTVLDKLVDSLFPMIAQIDKNIRMIEEDIFSDEPKRVIQELSIYRRDIIALRRIIRPQVGILAKLEEIDYPFIREELDDYFGDILDHITKIRDILEENTEVIIGLADTLDTLASVRINEVMRILTVISVIMLPLTLIAGIYGMNIPLPFQQNGAALVGVLALMLMISIGMLFYFRHRKWL